VVAWVRRTRWSTGAALLLFLVVATLLSLPSLAPARIPT
jgi:hypothetical protein